jgi:arylsulfatase A-like enzyme
MWMAGNGVKCGIAYGKTNDYGFEAVDGRVHVHDWHATIMHLLGLDHEKQTFRYAGRDMRLADACGNVVKALVNQASQQLA